MKKKTIITTVAGLAVGITGFAAAATVGSTASKFLSSGDSIVAACDSDGMTVTYTVAYNATLKRYDVTALNFVGVAAACDNLEVHASTRNNTTELSTDVTTVALTNGSFTVDLANHVEASLVNGVSVLITG